MKKIDIVKLLFLGLIFASGNTFSGTHEEFLDEFSNLRKEYSLLTEEGRFLVLDYMKQLNHVDEGSQEIYIDIDEIERLYQRDDATRTGM